MTTNYSNNNDTYLKQISYKMKDPYNWVCLIKLTNKLAEAYKLLIIKKLKIGILHTNE